jgi:hypothetical protein
VFLELYRTRNGAVDTIEITVVKARDLTAQGDMQCVFNLQLDEANLKSKQAQAGMLFADSCDTSPLSTIVTAVTINRLQFTWKTTAQTLPLPCETRLVRVVIHSPSIA